MPKWTTKAFVDDALGARDVAALTNLISDDDLPSEGREHLGRVIHGLLSRTIKFPRRRPPKRGLYSKKHALAEKVWKLKKAKGWKKIGSAIEAVASEEKCSPKNGVGMLEGL